MAGWQLVLAVFSGTLLSVCAETKHGIKELQQLAQTHQDNPLLLEVNTNDKEINNVIEVAMQEFGSQHGSLFKIVQYMNAKAQVLNGILYILDVFIGKTDCPASKVGPEATGCKVIKNFEKSEFYMCRFVLWTPPSSTFGQVLSRDCQKIDL